MPARSLRIAKATDDVPARGTLNVFAVSVGKYTELGAVSYNPSCWTFCTTPITSLQSS